ncbi:Serine/threonine-protein kinase wnk1 [Mortierella alpina]|uniref:non-specific serine/threonine protein kinase n=1 Tax=Mortierella alpina TaxID=64518 RepID=A0A9P6JEX5_MORAP|nr:Serine/threonine-protein kinase wnk1 [Mortierella alpina]
MGTSVQADQSSDTDGDTPLETDPSGRFQRLSEVLGEGAYKHVYRAFDQEEGVEVAWNQLRIDHLTKKEAQKILSEIEILESIRNDHIINFYASWSTKAPNGGERIVFVTELMSSGTLKQYLKKTLKGSLKPKVLKSWCRQILQGLVYLHTHEPPIIHRDLKCDNIFINGNNGQLKIGDLGLAVVRHKTHVSSVLGTPEFMAPELYDEKYDEKVDIYAFGMCVLEMASVTKEYPYSECTNQAQIYRKVTKGIKPQSLEHVQDPDIREFINRCLDHDDRTRPSAQELLDSDFLKPCLMIPAVAGSTLGHLKYSSRALSEGVEPMDGPLSATVTNPSSRSSFADHHLPFATSPSSTTSLPTPLSATQWRPLPSPIKVTPQPAVIPTTQFTTTTTVDADNKTYHIRSNLLPQTPTLTEPSSTSPTLEDSTAEDESNNESLQQDPSAATVEPPTLHSHANSKTCSIQVVQYGETEADQLNLKMICTCPVAGPRDVAMAAGTHEIKFPFHLNVDTVDEVVAEMIREQILSADDREEATARIQDLVDDVVYQRKERARVARELSRSHKASGDQPHRSSPTTFKNGHHRQLNVPSVYDLDQYGTSPTESLYDHYSSVGSNASTGWNGLDSSAESDQGYGTVPPQPPQQPPVITEATFPPLNHVERPQNQSAESAESVETSSSENAGHQHLVSYSEAVQHPAVAQHPLSPTLRGRDASPASSRPQSMYGADHKAPSAAKSILSSGVAAKATLRDIETGAARKRNDTEDVGYTSPYRHGVSSSSISYHRRSPSVDTSAAIASAASPSKPLQASPSDPVVSSSAKMQGTPEPRPASVSAMPSLAVGTDLRSASHSRDSSAQSAADVAQGHTFDPTFHLSLAPSSHKDQVTEQEHRLPHSTNAPYHESQHSHQHAFVAHPKTLQPSMTAVISSDAKKDIELWSNTIQSPDRMSSRAGFTNGSNYSSCPEMSDDEELMDEDLKVLRDKQRHELELMRLQHVQQWEKMMKLKEQKGLQDRIRRSSDTSATPPLPPLPPSHA